MPCMCGTERGEHRSFCPYPSPKDGTPYQQQNWRKACQAKINASKANPCRLTATNDDNVSGREPSDAAW